VLLRRVIGDALRARRQAQHRTLREVSTAANVSLGYLSEIERGQKEASSELLAAICDALGAALSDVLREVSDNLALAEEMRGVLVPVPGGPAEAAAPAGTTSEVAPAAMQAAPAASAVPVPAASAAVATMPAAMTAPISAPTVGSVQDATVSVVVRHDGPLKTTLRATRTGAGRGRDVVRAA
jgi:transcriptional regulator with XRE-family HTH domain